MCTKYRAQTVIHMDLTKYNPFTTLQLLLIPTTPPPPPFSNSLRSCTLLSHGSSDLFYVFISLHVIPPSIPSGSRTPSPDPLHQRFPTSLCLFPTCSLFPFFCSYHVLNVQLTEPRHVEVAKRLAESPNVSTYS